MIANKIFDKVHVSDDPQGTDPAVYSDKSGWDDTRHMSPSDKEKGTGALDFGQGEAKREQQRQGITTMYGLANVP